MATLNISVDGANPLPRTQIYHELNCYHGYEGYGREKQIKTKIEVGYVVKAKVRGM